MYQKINRPYQLQRKKQFKSKNLLKKVMRALKLTKLLF